MSEYEIGKDMAALIQKVEALEANLKQAGRRHKCHPIGRRDIEHTESGLLLPGYIGDPVGLNADGRYMWQRPARITPLKSSELLVACDVPLRWLQGTSTLRGGLCALEIDAPVSDALGSGSLISKRCVLTVAHGLFASGRYVAGIDVSPGRQGYGGSHIEDPFGTHRASLVRVPDEWRLHADERFDFGVAVLDSDDCFNRTNFYLGVEAYDWPSDPAFHYGNIEGYPGEGDGIVVGNPYFAYGQFTIESNFLRHRMTSYPGMSGGLYARSTSPDMTVIGVHHGGNCPNYGVRITETVIQQIFAWIDQYG